MEVFALDMAVREQGAATVERSMAFLRKEANGVAASMNNVGKQAVPALTNTERAASKAGIKIAGLATQFAATGSVSVAAVGGITEALSKLGVSVGTGSVFAAAIIGIGTLITSQMAKVREEAKRAVDAVLADARRLRTELNQIADETDADALARRRRRLQEGLTVFAPLEAGITTEDAEGRGINRLREDVDRLTQSLENARRVQREVGMIPLAERTREQSKAFLDANNVLRDTPSLLETVTQALANLNAQNNQLVITNKRVAESNREVAKSLTVFGKDGRIDFGNTQSGGQMGYKMSAGMRAEFMNALRQRVPTLSEDELAELMNLADLKDTLAMAVSGAIAGGFAAGIAEGIASGNFGAGFRELTSAILSGLGSAVIQFGIAQVKIGTLMQAAIEGLRSLNPVVTIAAGAALVGLGRAMGGSARASFGSLGRGGTGSTGSGDTGGESVTRIVFGPTSAGVAAGMKPRDFNQFIIIGPNDPTAQRAIEETLNRGNRRGNLR